MPWLAVVLVFLLGCREDLEETSCDELNTNEEVEDVFSGDERMGLRPRVPECEDSYATGVVISAAPPDGRLALAKHDQTMEESARLEALAWRVDGGGDPQEVFASYEWEIADEGVAFLLPFGAYGQAAMVWAREDRFDSGGEDPQTTLRVCAQNDCRLACGECDERVCSEPLSVVGVPNLEGRWQIVADTIPVPVAVDVRQDGEELLTGVADLEASIESDQVRVVFRGEIYTGTVARTRELVDGLVAREDDDRAHLTWSAARLDDW